MNLIENKGWVCPKCGRVYSPMTMSCFACNKKRDDLEAAVGAITPVITPVVYTHKDDGTEAIVRLTQGCSKGGQNPDNELNHRPPEPCGSGGEQTRKETDQ